MAQSHFSEVELHANPRLSAHLSLSAPVSQVSPYPRPLKEYIYILGVFTENPIVNHWCVMYFIVQ